MPGRCCSSRSSRSSFPASRSCITETAVNVFVIEPMRYCVSGVASAPASTSASPTAWTTPSLPSADDRGGERRQAFGLALAQGAVEPALELASGAGKEPQGARDELDRALDVVVVDVEVRDGAEHARTDRRGQADAGFGQPRRSPRRT